jgi:hypothetical protein
VAQEARNINLISHHDLNGFSNGGEGVALQQLADGRRIFWIAHESAPKDVTGVDVTDLANPRVVVQTELAHRHLRSNSLAVVDDLMLVAYQSRRPGQPGTGMGVYDVPRSPNASVFWIRAAPVLVVFTVCGGWMANTPTWPRGPPTFIPAIRKTTSSI